MLQVSIWWFYLLFVYWLAQRTFAFAGWLRRVGAVPPEDAGVGAARAEPRGLPHRDRAHQGPGERASE